MNALSWLLYLADVLPTLAGFLVISMSILGLCGLLSWIIGGANKAVAVSETEEKLCDFWEVLGKKFFLWSMIIIPVFLLVPSTQTFYLVAASEAGEVVIESDQAQQAFDRVMNLINTRLDALAEAAKTNSN